MISRSCIDPISGEEMEDINMKLESVLYFPVLFKDDKRGFILVEHIVDPDIKSLMINVIAETGALSRPHKLIEGVYDIIEKSIESTLDRLLPESIEYELSESMGSGICLTVAIQDYSPSPALQTEYLAKKILEELLMVLVKCRKCGFLVQMDEHKICPECGGDLETID